MSRFVYVHHNRIRVHPAWMGQEDFNEYARLTLEETYPSVIHTDRLKAGLYDSASSSQGHGYVLGTHRTGLPHMSVTGLIDTTRVDYTQLNKALEEINTNHEGLVGSILVNTREGVHWQAWPTGPVTPADFQKPTTPLLDLLVKAGQYVTQDADMRTDSFTMASGAHLARMLMEELNPDWAGLVEEAEEYNLKDPYNPVYWPIAGHAYTVDPLALAGDEVTFRKDGLYQSQAGVKIGTLAVAAANLRLEGRWDLQGAYGLARAGGMGADTAADVFTADGEQATKPMIVPGAGGGKKAHSQKR